MIPGMTTHQTVAQVAAGADPSIGHALHLASRIRGRLDALETAIAGRDGRARLRVTVELADLFAELSHLTYRSHP